MGTDQGIRKGARVRSSGDGITARWGRRFFGTVTRRRVDQVFVQWDGTSFEDQRHITEVRLVGIQPAAVNDVSLATVQNRD